MTPKPFSYRHLLRTVEYHSKERELPTEQEPQ